MSKHRIYNGDCLIEHLHIESGSVDLILTDLPYGTIKGLWDNTDWDNIIDTHQIFQIANRILRKNGKLILFAQQPFTTELIISTIGNLPHSYNMIWEKNSFGNALGCNKAPVNYTEDIVVFSKTYDLEELNPLRPYFKKIFQQLGYTKKQIIEDIGQRADHTFRFYSSQFDLCTEQTYDDLTTTYGLDKFAWYRPYSELKEINDDFKHKYRSTFNLAKGKKHKSNILKYDKDTDGYHPTQKPVALLEDLIRTFSNENDLVVDLTMGSGSTGVAALNTNRNFIGIEMDKQFYDIANNRLNKTQKHEQNYN